MININKQKIVKTPVKCLVCGYEWNYSKGIPKYRVKCPRCGSVRNKLNRETFGLWHPDYRSGTNKSQVIEK